MFYKIKTHLDLLTQLEGKTQDLALCEYSKRANNLINGHHSFRLSGTLNGKFLSCWGTDHDKDLALYKCIMEFIERMHFFNSCPIYYNSMPFGFRAKTPSEIAENNHTSTIGLMGKTTSGSAIHNGLFKSVQASIGELIERHTILFSLLLDIRPQLVSQETIEDNIVISCWQLPKHLNRHTVITKLNFKNSEGSYFFSACDKNLKLAQQKAKNESIPLIYHLQLYGDQKPEEFDLDTFKGVQDYYRWNSVDEIDEFFNKNNKLVSLPDLPKVKYFYCQSKLPILQGTNLVWTKVISPDLINYFIGNWKSSYIPKSYYNQFEFDLPKYPNFIV